MTAIREDLALLATTRLDDGRLLVARDVVEDSTIQIALWRNTEGGPTRERPALEIAADLRELAALRDLCTQVTGAAWADIGDGAEIAASTPLADGGHLAAVRAGDDVALVRRPEAENRVLLPRAAVERFATDLLPAAAAKLERLGLAQLSRGASG